MPERVLYLTYDGLSDPLGQSQILPYLEGLANMGHEIMVISFEKGGKMGDGRGKLEDRSGKMGVGDGSKLRVVRLRYHKSPPVLSTLYDLYLLRREVKKALKTQEIQIVHCRSYITSLVGLWAKRKFGVKFIFDMRGFWADERVEGGLWNLSNPVFRLIYGYFKKMERQFLLEADAVVSLTNNAKTEIGSMVPEFNGSTVQQFNGLTGEVEKWRSGKGEKWKGVNEVLDSHKLHFNGSTVQWFNGSLDKIVVIPTCSDLNHFSESFIDKKRANDLRVSLRIATDDYVLLYLGSLGTWYMLDEMLDFYDILRKKIGNSRLLFVTPDQQVLKRALVFRNYKPGEIIITSSSRADVPLYISLASSSIFFIKPTFSKKASAATKMGEIMAMGKPVITNTGWGDVDEILLKAQAGILVDDLNEAGYERGIESLLNLKIKPETIRDYAKQYFSLEKGVAAYDHIYRSC